MKYNPLNVITDAMLEKKAKGVVSLDLRKQEGTITDRFIVCSADSTTNVAAIAENVLVRMEEKCSRKVLRMQGLENDIWIILDYGDLVAHIFLTQWREFYRLEDLWADAPRKEWSDEPAGEVETPDNKEDEAPRAKTKSSSKVRASARRNKGGGLL